MENAKKSEMQNENVPDALAFFRKKVFNPYNFRRFWQDIFCRTDELRLFLTSYSLAIAVAFM